MRVHTSGKPVGEVDLGLIAVDRRLPGADLANICNEAAIFAARRKSRRVVGRPTSSRPSSAWSRGCSRAGRSPTTSAGSSPTTRPATRCAPSCYPASTARTTSRSCRAGARSATPCNLPDEDRYLKTRDELVDQMTVLLGGRAAEQLVFGAVTTGAADDLARVGEIACAMVHEFAMGT